MGYVTVAVMSHLFLGQVFFFFFLMDRMILVGLEEPMKIFLPGLLKIHLLPSLCMTALSVIRQFRHRRPVKAHL